MDGGSSTEPAPPSASTAAMSAQQHPQPTNTASTSMASAAAPLTMNDQVTASSSTSTRPAINPRSRRGRNVPASRVTSDALRSRVTYIAPTSHIILKLPSGRLKSTELAPGKQVNLGKFGSFKADDIIGMPFGFTYEIADANTLKLVMNSTLAELGKSRSEQHGRTVGDIFATVGLLTTDSPCPLPPLRSSHAPAEETDATNENIHDDGTAQKLTYVDIQALKEAGITGREIIQKQLEGSESFKDRTVYSQAKYVQRKEQKHLKLFTPLSPDLGTICKYNFEKNPDKIRWLRPDALAQCLSFASVRPGGRYLVVDGVSGLLTGAVLERLGGDGTVLCINDAESPPAFDVLSQFNFSDQYTRHTLKVIHWAATERDYRPVFVGQEEQIQAIDGSASAGAAAQQQGKKAKDKGRERKRQATAREMERNRAEYFRGDFDALLVACHYQPQSILERVKGAIGGSGSVVVHSPFLQPLTECHSHLRASEEFVNISVTEPWMRRYQVLPGRTHPEMTTSATGGFILHALRVLPEGEAQAMKEARQAELEALAAAETEQGASAPAQAPAPDAGASASATIEAAGKRTGSEDDREAKRVKRQEGEAAAATAQDADATMDDEVAAAGTATAGEPAGETA
ncbi:related to GCD10 - translation initiation factor eIF3 RNA-binding subunit [Pseudozyma flocculosa]|uniref:tRNA (adenine(58)-N(1))-methyltransferase non-catalytic subunit TRM6 n=1 Tax=Pseudozyma flocculosa TaxID=84751 RepID=A0A5C3EWH5_9BASI|nr:related to GCD10 - translation initiation factor eIF3 RNA-binding subunit [Pseudozyma flocculosa]